MSLLELYSRRPTPNIGWLKALLVVFLVGACSGGGMLTEGGWVFEGDDVIVVEPTASEAQEALDRAVRTFHRYDFQMNVVDRRARYVRTAPLALNDTLEIRLNALMTDSMFVEVAGEISRRSEAGGGGTWRRITWKQRVSRGETPWSLMVDMAEAMGSITGYEEDPTFDAVPCGGRRCSAGEVCGEYVCRED